MNIKLITGLVVFGVSFCVAAEQDIQALIKQKLKESGGWGEEEHITKDPASGFWTCHGMRLHMDVDLGGWQDLDSGEHFMQSEEPEPVDDNDKDIKVKGTTYTYQSMDREGILKFFIVDKSGKNLYLHDDVKFFKLYRCKRDE
ncbi:hypothetical protein DRU50_13125 [Salmonella enterica subsp. enterica serovar Mikawasima]|uniref:Uncharacterized protein n=1 Tax=Salmonella enterica subsp. enterica serovar Kottbus TaxID=224727 RepID=A0A5J0SA88_SALET|nr:hypothetical protein [Salmonella enterica subsp. enterica serovar Kottbus]EBS4015615.1 hypothetical protein [Salmonella enterica subsp. enterica serovar Mikawasima]EGM9155339.1 hypothetical protein [Salmonella enterica subsp. enterica serovar Newport]HAU3133873.1 hypothetical protein [Salmonella enterica subsp. diarizonae]HBL9523592.1 hypothetical protein [Salmonella enterica subsp. enterica serovar Kentucky]HCL5366173.1 hypothetical protein [Salmonella enterica]